MLEIILCSLVTIFRIISTAVIGRKALRSRDYAVFRVVRTAVWHHRLLMLTVSLITMIFYYHLDLGGDIVLPAVPIIPK